MLASLALGLLILIFGGLAAFSVVWVVASEQLTFLKPKRWVDTTLNLFGALILVGLLCSFVVGLCWTVGFLVKQQLGGL